MRVGRMVDCHSQRALMRSKISALELEKYYDGAVATLIEDLSVMSRHWIWICSFISSSRASSPANTDAWLLSRRNREEEVMHGFRQRDRIQMQATASSAV